jgi:hypothetical protein
MKETFTKTELAELCGLSLSAISHAVSRGQLAEDLAGRIPIEGNITWFSRQVGCPRAYRLRVWIAEAKKAARAEK